MNETVNFFEEKLLVTSLNAERGKGQSKYALQSLRALAVQIEATRDMTKHIGEFYEGFQNQEQIFAKLRERGYPSLMGCYRRLPFFSEVTEGDIHPFQNFAHRVEANLKGYEKKIDISWNNFYLTFKPNNSEKHLHFFSIQLGNMSNWQSLLISVFAQGAALKNHFFIFYWLPPAQRNNLESHQRFKSEFEINDKLWSYSRFLRDFLVGHKKAVEVPLVDNFDSVDWGLFREFLKSNPDMFSPYNQFKDVSKEVRRSLVATYGSGFEWMREFDGEGVKDEDVARYVKAVAQLYLHNRSNQATSNRDEWIDIEKSVVGGSINTASGDHGVLGEMDKRLMRYRPAKDVVDDIKAEINKGIEGSNDIKSVLKKNLESLRITDELYFWGIGENYIWSHFLKTMTSLVSANISWKADFPVSFLCIDDNPDRIIEKLKTLRAWFPKGTVGYLHKDKWKDFFRSASPLKELEDKDIQPVEEGAEKPTSGNVTFLLIDLEYDGEPLGFELLRKLRSETRGKNAPFIITLSRRDDPESIQRSLNSGALFHITKSHFFDIVPAVCQVWKHIENLCENDKKRYAEYENWHLLSKLPLRKQLELQSTQVSGKEYDDPINEERWIDGFTSSPDYRWIKNLPKAEIHCHIGSCMGADLLPKTALLVLAEKVARPGEPLGKHLESVIKFLLPIAGDPFLIEGEKNPEGWPGKENYMRGLGFQEKEAKSVFEIITEAYPLREHNILPEKALLDPQVSIIEDTARNFKSFQNSEYFNLRESLRANGICYDEIMLVFTILLSLRSGSGQVATQLEKHVQEIEDRLEPILDSDKDYMQKTSENLMVFTEKLKNLIPNPNGVDKNFLGFLQSAHSPKRCLPPGESSLFSYLRGCEYSGSQHLQTKASIFLTVNWIVEQYALPEKIRYLCLRAAVNGYTKFNLQTGKEATEALLKAISVCTYKACKDDKKVHINIIIAANRQRDGEDFTKNADLALDCKDWTDPGGIYDEQRFFPARPRVVSFDLFGLEKGNRPSKFKEQFKKLQRNNFPTTIHAGEEDNADAIAEAVYEAFTSRIGHGLTLKENVGLMKTVRERHIAIELCPISNLLTSGKYIPPLLMSDGKPDSSWNPDEMKSYPLRHYLNHNLDVTINTDNPVVSASNLTQEYLVAARYVGGLTKWEILRLIKNSFRAAVIPKDEKRKLMNEIDAEIYELLLNED